MQTGKREKDRTAEPEPSFTRSAIRTVLLFVVSIVSLLALLGRAGSVGDALVWLYLRSVGSPLYVIVPIALFVFALLTLRVRVLKTSQVLGVLLFFLSCAGFAHLLLSTADGFQAIRDGRGGGYVGLVFSLPFRTLLGSTASGVVMVGLFFISLILLFEAKLMVVIRTGAAGFQFIARLFRFSSRRQGEGQSSRDVSSNEEVGSIQDEEEMLFTARPIGAGEEPVQKKTVSVRSDRLAAGRLPKKNPPIDIPLDLLSEKRGKATAGDIEFNKEVIQKTLFHFGIEVEMGEVAVGPTVAQYTLRPKEGIKLSRITALQNDLSLALAAHPLRIEAPIPGKSLVGVEVPNLQVATVSLKEILTSREFHERTSNLTIPLGKDVSGKPWVVDLASMPHLLIAGATGSGKSVMINAIIVGFLFQNQPDRFRMILVDPKRVEMHHYNGIPHLLTPVITDIGKTIHALKWVVGEMEQRFEMLAESHVRNIEGYNQKHARDPMPYLVLIIDELADIIAVAANEVEAAVVRLSQMARAVGIHLIIATQRPSVDVITGLIKANITSRIAFSVASVVDSRTILDSAGADKLLGRGDMLFISAALGKPRRLQGAFVADDDIQRVTDYLRAQSPLDLGYRDDVVAKPSTGNGSGAKDWEEGDDPLYEEAKSIIVQAGKASASYLQRRLRVGYARAARLLDLLEQRGVIGPADGARPRDVLVTKDGSTSGLGSASSDMRKEGAVAEEIESEGDGEEIEENVSDEAEEPKGDSGIESSEEDDEGFGVDHREGRR